MRLLINTSNLRFGGAVQVALSFIHECRNHVEHEYHVVVGPGVGSVLDKSTFPENFHFYEKSFGIMGIGKLRRVQREMSELEKDIVPDCVVTTSGPSFWRSRAPHLIGFNLPLFIYPESPYLKSMTIGRKAKLFIKRWLHCWFFRRDADALIVQTDDVNSRVRRLLGKTKVYTVTNTHNGWFDQLGDFSNRLSPREDCVFRLLTLTSYYPHKNLKLIPRLIEVLSSEIRSRVEFVLTLTESQYRQHIGPEIPPQIKLVGPVPPPECPSLYRECDAMFLPTLAECFSASYAEAMKMEKPIVTTDLGFAQSVCGDAALYFDPTDARSAADEVTRLVRCPEIREQLRGRGVERLRVFDSPADRAEKIINICESLFVSDCRTPGSDINRS